MGHSRRFWDIFWATFNEKSLTECSVRDFSGEDSRFARSLALPCTSRCVREQSAEAGGPKSNQKMNDQLKVIAEKLGFTRDITKMQFSGKSRIDETHRLCDVIGTHSARRTFVVHALEMGWSPQLVMSYTGHEDYDTMKPYIALTDKTRKKMMETNF